MLPSRIQKQRGCNEQIVFTTTLSITALFRISQPKKVIHYFICVALFQAQIKKDAHSSIIFYLKNRQKNPHLNIEYRWGMNAVNASDREIWSKK